YRAQHLSIADAGFDLHGRVFAVRLPRGGHEGRLETGDRSGAADIGYTVAQSAQRGAMGNLQAVAVAAQIQVAHPLRLLLNIAAHSFADAPRPLHRGVSQAQTTSARVKQIGSGVAGIVARVLP